MLSYTLRPHITAFTILLKLSSVRMISEASFATSVPAIPYRKQIFYMLLNSSLIINTIANPTSAFFNAGPSFVPSPVTATTSRLSLILLSIIPLTNVYLSVGDDLANTRNFGHTLSKRCC